MSISKIDLTAISSKLQIKESTEVSSTDAVEKGSSIKEAKLSKVEFSDNAKLYMEAIEAVKSSPDIRLDKIAELKAAIVQGNYKIDSAKVAEKMLSSHLLDR